MTSTAFRPERAILELDGRFHTPVEPAKFPKHVVRWRNQPWAQCVGLGHLSEQRWIEHFSQFAALDGSLDRPLALAYHGHQFQTYNPNIGDGRGFLYAQLRDPAGRLLDLGTKGSGRTPFSRSGDGRLTLKGGVREVLAAGMLEALGVSTSKAFSLIETGEELARQDEPSPTRSSVLVRLSHSHIRFGSFERQAYLGDADALAELVHYCVRHLHPEASGPTAAVSALGLMRAVVHATADLTASWMAAGFVHGVLNTDNMVVTGESFDYGPWRFLPYSDPSYTAAYFDETGLYAFGRQPSAALWNLSRLAGALTLIADAAPLEAALSEFEPAYRLAFRQRSLGALGLHATDEANDIHLLKTFFAWMTATKASWPQVFFDWFGGVASADRALAGPLGAEYRSPDFSPVMAALTAREPLRPERLAHPYFGGGSPARLLIEDVERIWTAIATDDDWSLMAAAMAAIAQAKDALALVDNPKRMT